MTTARLTLRPARSTDIPRLIEIRAAVGENRSDPASIGAAHFAPYIAAGRCWVAEENGAILGFSALDAEAASVWALFVASGAQRRGLGRGLLETLIAEARRLGLGTLRLETEAGSRAERVYRAGGWSFAGQGAGGDLVMTLTL